MKLTARSRLSTYASASRTQSDEETYGLRTEETMKPEWMPPLPDFPMSFYDGAEVTDVERELQEWARTYALAVVESYKRSLKPVAWMYEDDGCMDQPIIFSIPWNHCEEPWTETPLYRIDGGDDDAA